MKSLFRISCGGTVPPAPCKAVACILKSQTICVKSMTRACFVSFLLFTLLFFVIVWQPSLWSLQNSIICGASCIISMAGTSRISFLLIVKIQSAVSGRLGQPCISISSCSFPVQSRPKKKYSSADRIKIICQPFPVCVLASDLTLHCAPCLNFPSCSH